MFNWRATTSLDYQELYVFNDLSFRCITFFTYECIQMHDRYYSYFVDYKVVYLTFRCLFVNRFTWDYKHILFALPNMKR